ncbi:MAG: hypothetical protein N2651_02000 [Fimbriimonadales bacterium]|nr:hypothetical protein [Fimbriimonadales bacterium]
MSGAMRDRVQAHLDACTACRGELEFFQAIWRGLSAMPEVTPPADLHGRIMTHVRANARVREAHQRVAFWRWAGAAAVAAGLFLMGFFAAQSDSVKGENFPAPVQKKKPEIEMPQPVQAGVFIVYRQAENGARLPVLEARMNREVTAELYYAPDPETKAESMVVWQGKLQPGKTVEIPLQMHLQHSKERVLTLWWVFDGQKRVLFVPAGYPPAKIASVRLQAKLGDALRQLASLYQTPIEWVPNGEEPLVVLDVEDATLEGALHQLLIGSTYGVKRHGETWRVVSK